MKNILYIMFFLSMPMLFAQALITDTAEDEPNANAILETRSADKGMIVPRLTTQAMTNLKDNGTAVEGLIVFDSDRKCYFGYQNSDWTNIGGGCSTQEVIEGDFIYTGFRTSSNVDRFSFISLKPIVAGEVFYLTDNELLSDGTFSSGEGLLKWEVTVEIPARTEILFNQVTSGSPWSASAGTLTAISGTLTFNNSGDQFYTFKTADDTDPLAATDKTYITAVALQTTFNDGTMAASIGYLPSTLALGTTAVELTFGAPNQWVNCSNITSGMSDVDLKAAVNDYDPSSANNNWSTSSNTTGVMVPTGCSY